MYLFKCSTILLGKSQALLVETSNSNLAILAALWKLSLSIMPAELALRFPSQD